MWLTAIAIAISDSVTVSIGDDTRGAFKVIFLVKADVSSCNQLQGINKNSVVGTVLEKSREGLSGARWREGGGGGEVGASRGPWGRK